jgi:glutamate-1-semialdehyde 2,1-aminomutase
VPSLDAVRFCNSGTEATMFAMRLARAFTGRPKIARIEGGYHGTHDFAEVSTHPAVEEAGPADAPLARPDSIGTPAWVLDQTVVLPFNNPDAAEAILRREASSLAAVILEPIIGAGGVIAATHDFLERLRRVTSELGILLIFDEVISFRVAPGGAQELYGVKPDLTTLGKIIGGGYALAAFGGRAEIMDRFDARRHDAMSHGGTFNGNPVAAAAGLATLRELTPDRYDRLAELGGRLRARLADAFARDGIDAHVDGIASLFQVFTGPTLAGEAGLAASQTLFLGLLVDGFHLAPRGMGAISTPVTEQDVDELADAIVGRLGVMSGRPAAGVASAIR